MHRTALILTACLLAAATAGAAGRNAGVGATTPFATVQAAAIPAWLPLAQKADAAEAKETESAAENGPARERTPVAQQIVAGILTGSFAAVLMFRLVYGRRRKDDPR